MNTNDHSEAPHESDQTIERKVLGHLVRHQFTAAGEEITRISNPEARAEMLTILEVNVNTDWNKEGRLFED